MQTAPGALARLRRRGFGTPCTWLHASRCIRSDRAMPVGDFLRPVDSRSVTEPDETEAQHEAANAHYIGPDVKGRNRIKTEADQRYAADPGQQAQRQPLADRLLVAIPENPGRCQPGYGEVVIDLKAHRAHR